MPNKLRTYLVEDNPTIRDNLIATLEDLAEVVAIGYAETETAAKSWLRSNEDSWDLAIVDIFLQEGSGLGVLEHLQQRGAHQHMVVLSNYSTPSIRARCTQLGADRVFDKSQDIDALIDFCVEYAQSGNLPKQ
ncbi:MAG: response regulator [Comamonas sp.]